MAKYKTSAEAIAVLSKQLKDKQTLLKGVVSTNDPVLRKNKEKLEDEISKLENQLYIETLSAKGDAGKLGVTGMGLLAGIPRGFTSVIDLAGQGAQYLEKTFPKAFPAYPGMRQDPLLTPKMLPGVESSSEESEAELYLADAFRWKAWASATEMTRKYQRPVLPNADKLQEGLNWLRDGPLEMTDEMIRNNIRQYPGIYLREPNVFYKKVLGSAPRKYRKDKGERSN